MEGLAASAGTRALGVRLLLGLVGSGLWLGACVIPERTYDASLDPSQQVVAPSTPAVAAADAGSDASPGASEVSPACREYCSTVMNECRGQAAVYASADECLAICRRLPEGEPGVTGVNSVQCRLSELRRTGFEPIDCADVGPISVDETCGEPCQTFCDLQRASCTDAEAYCTSVCRDVLRKEDTYSIGTFANTDTLQCRVNNLVRAAASGTTDMACEEARVAPSGQEFSCQDGPTFPVGDDREYYCTLMDFSCREGDAVYDDHQQCLDVSALFETGPPDAFGSNTLRCRRLHAYFSLEAGEKSMHCRHAGPTGDGGCGNNCDSYCRIVARSCPDAFNNAFATTQGVDSHTACVDDCTADDSGMPDAVNGTVFGTALPFYSVNATPPPGTLKCRTLNAVRALAAPDDAQLCTAALGAADSPCAPLN